MKIIIYIFGNPLIEEDNTPLKLMPELKNKFPNINFIEIDPNENLKPNNKKLIIIDTAVDIDKVILIDDIETLETNNSFSMHDMDLAFNLKLLYKIGKLEKIKIFAIPPNIKKEEALEQLTTLISNNI
ncbi:hypothetical protein A2331_05835 [Candidatus Falkowbacteria bacterium RIFOXYB2_FULL_34_18]|uniref:Hydrogenase maturation protease n=1 Tax=Candidatus Falkowbacteria bacterium RIFOXYD2_FULL_34_120 TaxID=1798007 RepID=A0A1F5TLU2_9BACT|nr:MAG: hypothetical protein A2331_05835 [Candidatus Falkowbacteria bacterium RIFOXYB2_FULL_34_18]OGF29166.1 MAG: hypothetical protein A2500_05780 [Candidatus Falkowbacteria bacterium RIFOXYC12_FULL_34_55]OGF36972.1 MAG: hypothetical protein A2466_07160 [Candidatus Falkowbacteria bacterium RIFOXYC2_FULL_34_220]OGF38688.1 MAG: hypothetical protein A2515_01445 [Candidatus Falkowbacteria bacterium RIFOXYD12_FULL_34_57]OGF39922.1 MAG: hypothetical protein A2531_01700 [Candidatus Falkowbacteria bact